MFCYSKFHFKQQLCGEEHQYKIRTFLFLLKKQKKIANKNEAINILGFKWIWISL